MKPSASTLGLIVVIVILIVAMMMLPEPSDTASHSTENPDSIVGLALSNARLFDGYSVHDSATLLIRDGLVETVQTDGVIPEGYEIIDINGQTLLPGLIDAHVHSYLDARQDALRFGVTTMLDMFRAPYDMTEVIAQRESTLATNQADLFSAGFLATAAGGHGTQFGIEVPTLSDPAQAEAWVEDRIAEGSDYVKIVLENGSSWGSVLPTLSDAIVRALVEAAHENGMLAVAHVSTQSDALLAVEAGVDGLVHLFADELIDPAFIELAVEREVFIIPTATVLAGAHNRSGRPWIQSNATLAIRLSAAQRQSLGQNFPGSAMREARWSTVPESIAALHEAGVTLLAGSDAPNPATAQGVSLLHELKLLTDSGMAPIDALRAATSKPAEAFELADRGCLRVGCRADVVQVNGNPLNEIDDIRNIVAVWKNGSKVGLEVEDTQLEVADGEALVLPIDMHAAGQWMAATDQFMGGQSTATLSQLDDGARVQVTGQLNSGFPFPYAGVMWNPGDEMMAAVNLSNAQSLHLRLESGSGTYQIMLFSGENVNAAPVRIDIDAGGEQTIDLNDLDGLDRSRLRAIGIFAIGASTAVDFTVENARLQ